MTKPVPTKVKIEDNYNMDSPSKKKRKTFIRTWVSQTKRYKIKCYKNDEGNCMYDSKPPAKHRFHIDKHTGKLCKVECEKVEVKVEVW